MIRVQPPSRRLLYRAAKESLRKALRKRWKGGRARLERLLRDMLRARSASFLRAVVRAPACAAIVLSCAFAAGAYGEPSIDLSVVESGNGGFVINAGAADSRTGRSVSGGGDINGDGLADVIVSAPIEDAGDRTEAGRTYVIFGRSDTSPVDLDAIAQNIHDHAEGYGFVINGASAYDRSGWSVSHAGDVNRDGRDDIVIGAPSANPGGKPGAGQTFVVFGKSDTTPVDLKDIAAGAGGGFVINGIKFADFSGREVSDAGDVNADGCDDVVVGAPFVAPEENGTFRPFVGQSYVVFGKTDPAPVELANVVLDDASMPGDSGGFLIQGLNDFDELGSSVSTAGDQNGDGLDDIIVSAVYRRFHAYVIFGKVNGAQVDLTEIIAGTGGYLIDGNNVSGDFGASVSIAGDANGDGVPDTIVGAPSLRLAPTYDVGEAYVVFGKGDGAPVDAAQVASDDSATPGDSGGFVINGVHEADYCGASVSDAGDFNGDGLGDVLVGCPRADLDGQSSAGKVGVVFGKPNGAPVPLKALEYNDGLAINGAEPGDRAGVSVSSAGDVNGDGRNDIIIGAPQAGDGGKAYVVFSSQWVFVDFEFAGTELGTLSNPFNTIGEAVAFAPHGGTIVVVPGAADGPLSISKRLTLANGEPAAGVVRIGAP